MSEEKRLGNEALDAVTGGAFGIAPLEEIDKFINRHCPDCPVNKQYNCQCPYRVDAAKAAYNLGVDYCPFVSHILPV